MTSSIARSSSKRYARRERHSFQPLRVCRPVFAGMSSRDLRYLATQLATGALGPPYPYVALNKLGMAGPTLVADLERLNAQGFSPAQLAWLVVAVAGEREHL